MKSYLSLLNLITLAGYKLPPAQRQDVGTTQINNHLFEHDLRTGFPLLTTKKMFTKGIIAELLWMLSGGTNIKPLVDAGVNIWNEDAWKYYLRKCKEHGFNSPFTLEEFIFHIKEIGNPYLWNGYAMGDIGPGYGYQMRNFNGQGIDQIQNLVDNIKAAIASGNNNRRLIVNMWNPSQVHEVALPWCHKDFQVILEPIPYGEHTKTRAIPQYFLNLTWNQRSVDTFLGLPFNIAYYAFLAHMLAQQTGTIAKDLVGELRNVHLYDNHMDQVREQVRRTPYQLPTLSINPAKDIFSYTPEDFKILHYQSHPALKADMVS